MHRPSLKIASVVSLLGLLLWWGPCLWRGYLGALGTRGGALHTPRERLAGNNAPPVPRVAPASEGIAVSGLLAAAAYAAAHGSLALIVARHDHIVFERYWHGSRLDTRIDAQDMTAILGALATGVALSHRRLGWPDEPVGLLLPAWRQDARGAITLRQLLQMSSGLAPRPAPGSDLAKELLRRPLQSRPGTRRLEQPADPELLALVLQQATGLRFTDYVSGTLWRPLGAGDAWYWVDRAGGTVHADCCLLSRQGDWIRVGALLLHDGNYRGDELIRPGWVGVLRTPALSDTRFGAYLRLSSAGHESFLAPDLFVLGSSGAHRLWLVPSLDLAILCTGARPTRDGGWVEARIPNLILTAVRDFQPAVARPGDLSSIVPGH
ncbi:MAG: serine hydrolase [Gammaproteobacteria bacterium]|nr:serine hydrolase [Gammaproteobacteria bacterium]